MRAKWISLLALLIFLSACTMEATPLGSPAPTPGPSPVGVALANPAAAACTQKGYQDQIRTASDGSQYGVCIFPDGSLCDDWAYYRGDCGPGTKTPDLPTRTPLPTQAAASSTENKVVEAARTALANRLNISPFDISLSAIERVTFTNTCLDLADPTEACDPVDTPGFKIGLIVGAATFVFHTDLTGANIRMENGTSQGTH